MFKIRCATLALNILCVSVSFTPPLLAKAQETIAEEDRRCYNTALAAMKLNDHAAAAKAMMDLAESENASMQTVVQSRLPAMLYHANLPRQLLQSLDSGRLAGKVSPDYSLAYFKCCYGSLLQLQQEESCPFARQLLATISKHGSSAEQLAGIEQSTRLYLARTLWALGDVGAAERELTQDLKSSPPAQELWGYIYHSKMMRAFEASKHTECIRLSLATEAINQLPSRVLPSFHQMLIECAVATGNPSLGLNHHRQLTEWLQSTESSAYKVSLPRLQLRHAELLLMAKRFDECGGILSEDTQFQQDRKLRSEYHFLQARLAIAKIDFASAKQILSKLCADSGPRSEPYARASWMLGELAVMQRDFASAVVHYRRASEQDAHAKWHANALIQLARCYEQMGDPDNSIVTYRRYLEIAEDRKQSDEVTRRIAALQTDILQR